MDVTTQLLNNDRISGMGGNTSPDIAASSKSLVHAAGSNILKPIEQNITAFPISVQYKDSVGLFGSENTFIKINLNITDTISMSVSVEEPDEFFSFITIPASEDESIYASAKELYEEEIEEVYKSAFFNSGIKSPETTRISVNLENTGTGNKYVDRYLDVTLYNRDKQPIEYDLMYLKPNDYFYVGIHARKLTRLPYNIKVIVGLEYLSTFNLTSEQRRYEG